MINPKAMPVEILPANGIIKMIMKAVKPSSNEDHLIFANPSIMKQPTIINAGAVIDASDEIAETTGEKNIVNRNMIATTTAVKPVRPPTATPVLDST